MADPVIVLQREIAAAAAAAELERQRRPVSPPPDYDDDDKMDVDVNANVEMEAVPGKSRASKVKAATATSAPVASFGDMKFGENLRPLIHSPDCVFEESRFVLQMKGVLLTPQRFEAQLINENLKHVEEGKRHGRKLGNIHKRPTKEIAYSPFVLEYLAQQRDLVTKHRQDLFNLCDCAEMEGQSRVRTIRTVFPSDLERQRAQALAGIEVLPDLFLEKRPVERTGRMAQSRRPLIIDEGVPAMKPTDVMKTKDVVKRAAMVDDVKPEKHLLVKTDADITEMDVCMAMGPYNKMDVFPIIIPGHGPAVGPVIGGVSAALVAPPPEPIPSTSTESVTDAVSTIVDKEPKPIKASKTFRRRQVTQEQADLVAGLNLNLSEDDTTVSNTSDEEEGGILA